MKIDYGRIFRGQAMKLCLKEHNFYRKQRELVAECDAICTLYAQKGYTLTIRQLYYQLVSRNRIENTEREYKNLIQVMVDARYAGLIDWQHITDRVRVLKNDYSRHFENPEDAINYHAEYFSIDLWKDQDRRPEVWIEKDALIEVAANACVPLGVPYIAVKAYNSASELWQSRKRFLQYRRDGKDPVILHLGDHDSTGDDCSRLLQERMELMTGRPIELRRIALNRDQIEKYKLPPQAGKTTDPRFKGYVAKHGTSHVWELDALGPDVIESIIDGALRDYMDEDLHDEALAEQSGYQDQMRGVSDNWDEVQELIKEVASIKEYAATFRLGATS